MSLFKISSLDKFSALESIIFVLKPTDDFSTAKADFTPATQASTSSF